jgi:hypothetical protein
MIVVCDGMPRSGSTWAFNVCLRLVRLRWPGANVYCGFRRGVGDYLNEMGPDHDHAVLKTHRLDTAGMALSLTGGVHSIHTHRDPYDAVFSFLQMFHPEFEIALEALRRALVTRAFHEAYDNALMIPYNQVRRAPKRTIRTIAEYLNFALSPAQVSLVHDEMAFDKVKAWSSTIGDDPALEVVRLREMAYDPETSFHRNHVRDGRSGNGRRMLTLEQRRLVDALLKRHGRK